MNACLVCGKEAEMRHLKTVGAGRTRKIKRWEDLTCVPLCRIHHTELHQIGENRFSEKYNINLWRECCIKLAKGLFVGNKLAKGVFFGD